MKLQDQVCTVEQAVRLKELGINQHYPHSAHFMWFGNGDRNHIGENIGVNCIAAAFSCAELGLILEGWTSAINHYVIMSDKDNSAIPMWGGVFGQDEDEIWMGCEAHVRAALLIKALEEGEIEVEEVNTRLTS